MFNDEDRKLLLNLVNQSQFNGAHAERISELKRKLMKPDSSHVWENTCRNLLPTEEFERICDRVASTLAPDLAT